jgi:hypothetical protein
VWFALIMVPACLLTAGVDEAPTPRRVDGSVDGELAGTS